MSDFLVFVGIDDDGVLDLRILCLDIEGVESVNVL